MRPLKISNPVDGADQTVHAFVGQDLLEQIEFNRHRIAFLFRDSFSAFGVNDPKRERAGSQHDDAHTGCDEGAPAPVPACAGRRHQDASDSL